MSNIVTPAYQETFLFDLREKGILNTILKKDSGRAGMAAEIVDKNNRNHVISFSSSATRSITESQSPGDG